MSPGASEDAADLRSLGYTFGVLVLGLVGILVGVVLLQHAPRSLGGALIIAGYILVYAGFLGGLYFDLRGDGSVVPDRPFDGESG